MSSTDTATGSRWISGVAESAVRLTYRVGLACRCKVAVTPDRLVGQDLAIGQTGQRIMNLYQIASSPRRAHAPGQSTLVRQHGALLRVTSAAGAGFGRHGARKNRCPCQQPCTKARKFCAQTWCAKTRQVQPNSICTLRAQPTAGSASDDELKGVPHASRTAGALSNGRKHHDF